jgi:hypothetical protein
MKFIYGVFPDHRPAEQAVENLEHDPDETQHEIATIAIHTQDLRNADLPRSGNFAPRSALIGALLVGGSVGLFLTLLMTGVFSVIGGPTHIVGSRPLDVVLLTLATALFGGIAAGLAGTAGDRATVRRLQKKLVNGRVLLTLEASNERANKIVRTLNRHGALEAGSV